MTFTPPPGECKALDENLDQYFDRKPGGGFSITLHSKYKDRMATVSYKPNGVEQCRAIGNAKFDKSTGKFTVVVYPGEVQPVFASDQPTKGYGMSWRIETPDSSYCEKVAAKIIKENAVAIKGMRAVLKAAGKTDSDIDNGRVSSEEMARIAEQYDVSFVDLNFPPQQVPSLFREFEVSEQQRHSTDICRKTIPWVKPRSLQPLMYPDYKGPISLFLSKIDISALSQGASGKNTKELCV